GTGAAKPLLGAAFALEFRHLAISEQQINARVRRCLAAGYSDAYCRTQARPGRQRYDAGAIWVKSPSSSGDPPCAASARLLPVPEGCRAPAPAHPFPVPDARVHGREIASSLSPYRLLRGI